MPWQDVGKSCGDRHSALQGGFFCACRVCSSGRDSAGKSAYRFRSGSSSVVFLRIPPLAGIRGKGHCLQKKTSDDMPYFSAYAGRQRGVGNHSVTSSSTSTVRVTFRTAPVALAAPRKIASFRSIVKRRNFPGMRKSFVPALLRASLSVIHCSAR